MEQRATTRIKTDVLVIGGGTARTMAGIKAKQANPDAEVLILEKANIRRSGAIPKYSFCGTGILPVQTG